MKRCWLYTVWPVSCSVLWRSETFAASLLSQQSPSKLINSYCMFDWIRPPDWINTIWGLEKTPLLMDKMLMSYLLMINIFIFLGSWMFVTCAFTQYQGKQPIESLVKSNKTYDVSDSGKHRDNDNVSVVNLVCQDVLDHFRNSEIWSLSINVVLILPPTPPSGKIMNFAKISMKPTL